MDSKHKSDHDHTAADKPAPATPVAKPAPPPKPVEPHTDAMSEIVAILEHILAMTPALAGMRNRVLALRERIERMKDG